MVPLLHPQQHGLPFALTLELHTAPAPPPPPRDARSAADPVYALHYVLAGSGQLVRPHGAAEPLQAGDAVLMHAGAAACCAAAGGEGLGGADASLGAPVHMAELVALMPSQLFEQQQQRGEQPGVQPSSLALPLPQPDGGSGAPVQCLSEELAAALLAGAKATARQAVLYNQAAAAAAAQRRPGTPSSPLQLLQAAVGGLSAWWQAQQGRTCPVTKRTLAELTAFQLPNQSNRLAVQFDPFTQPQVRPLPRRPLASSWRGGHRGSTAAAGLPALAANSRTPAPAPLSPVPHPPSHAPQVPFISGVEVFEPGHRTTPHVHPQAHELFFILAGEGVGFCGDRRFPGARLGAAGRWAWLHSWRGRMRGRSHGGRQQTGAPPRVVLGETHACGLPPAAPVSRTAGCPSTRRLPAAPRVVPQWPRATWWCSGRGRGMASTTGLRRACTAWS